ncbi:MAG TPA: methylmalonyl Co-A mutase-associated GTPase MeaB [Acidimicrobiales bacterium]|nr:methylmalonyl Co-A mutase-associated GTPase MeaB [Acidimicrobiales bacterium]
MPHRAPEDLVEATRAGDRAALARLLSMVERGGDDARAAGRALRTGGACAYAVGITGAPGAGKSTLTSALVELVRRGGERVAVLAVDPSSPFTGGALLGDRIRMGDHALDDGVFIRSMATRGHLGGLAVAAPEAVRVLSAAGYPWVLLETVGVGQVEVEVVGQADTTVVVLNPGWGDAVQANKAGLLEIADVFVVNKADRPGAEEARRDIERMLDVARHGTWRPPVVPASAVTATGVGDVWQAVRRHRAHLEASGHLAERRRRRAADEVSRLVAAQVLARARQAVAGARGRELAAAVAAGDLDPWHAADELLDGLGGGRPVAPPARGG